MSDEIILMVRVIMYVNPIFTTLILICGKIIALTTSMMTLKCLLDYPLECQIGSFPKGDRWSGDIYDC